MSPPHFWPITYARPEQHIAAPGMQLLSVLENHVGGSERKTCKEELHPPNRDLLWVLQRKVHLEPASPYAPQHTDRTLG